MRAVGFEPIGEEWPSVYIHEKLQLVLVVYVDDFKMAGPQKNLAQGWSMLRTRLKIEPETGLDMYLGCNQSKGNVTLGNGHRVTTVTYDMEQFLRSCVDRYLEVAGDVKLNKVVTPDLHEETKNHVSRKPVREGPSVVCNWCNNLVPTDGSATVPDQRGGTPELAMKEPVRGHLAPHAASVLMKLLYGARIARFDLLRQVNRLARNVHRWTDSDDRGLRHLMCYVHHTKHWRMVGWVGDPMDDVHLALYADADFAGCIDSLRSTSGGRLNTQGPNTRFPIFGSLPSYLAYEVTDRMAADIYTKAFNDGRKWKHACLQIGHDNPKNPPNARLQTKRESSPNLETLQPQSFGSSLGSPATRLYP